MRAEAEGPGGIRGIDFRAGRKSLSTARAELFSGFEIFQRIDFLRRKRNSTLSPVPVAIPDDRAADAGATAGRRAAVPPRSERCAAGTLSLARARTKRGRLAGRVVGQRLNKPTRTVQARSRLEYRFCPPAGVVGIVVRPGVLKRGRARNDGLSVHAATVYRNRIPAPPLPRGDVRSRKNRFRKLPARKNTWANGPAGVQRGVRKYPPGLRDARGLRA